MRQKRKKVQANNKDVGKRHKGTGGVQKTAGRWQSTGCEVTGRAQGGRAQHPPTNVRHLGHKGKPPPRTLTEVRHLGHEHALVLLAARQQDIVAGEIPMQDVAAMQVAHGARNLLGRDDLRTRACVHLCPQVKDGYGCLAAKI